MKFSCGAKGESEIVTAANRVIAMAPVQSPTLELPHAQGAAKGKKKSSGRNCFTLIGNQHLHDLTHKPTQFLQPFLSKFFGKSFSQTQSYAIRMQLKMQGFPILL